MMQQMMNSPFMEAMLNNPDMLRNTINSNPQLQAMMDANPHIRCPIFLPPFSLPHYCMHSPAPHSTTNLFSLPHPSPHRTARAHPSRLPTHTHHTCRRPCARHVLNDPAVLRQSMEMMRNPNAMQQGVCCPHRNAHRATRTPHRTVD